eukprot:gene14808-14942_t
MEPGWHINGPEAVEAGNPLTLNWSLPTGVRILETVWPEPKMLEADVPLHQGKMNKKVALESEDFLKKVNQLGIVVMRADWTNQDPKITVALADYGRNSVPLYVLHQGGEKSSPIILPQILTPKILSHARFLSETEMQSFIEAHKKEITNALPGANAHKGYRVIAVAHEMMQANFFDAPHKPKVAAYYSNVILSALKGIGVGGLSSKNKASFKEKSCALMALYEDGIVSSVELHMPDGEVIFFDEIYMNSEYSRITNDCDSALLKGKSAIKRILKPVLPMPIDSKMHLYIKLKYPVLFKQQNQQVL